MDEEFTTVTRGDVVVVAEMPFIAIVHRHEMRDRLANGLLAIPPRLYVVSYSRERDCTTLRPVDWEIAGKLAPDDMHRFGRRLKEMRSMLDAADAPANDNLTPRT